jgi:hypothetical protein
MKKGIGQKIKWQVILLLARRLPPCNVLLPMFSEERERPLTLREKITKKLHLFTCEACRRYVAQIEQMSEMVKPQNEMETAAEPSLKLSDDARTRIRAALEAAAHGKQK